MRLSEAINLGSSVLKPIGAHIEGCAMGMALMAVDGKIVAKESAEAIRKHWEWATEMFLPSPCECPSERTVRPVSSVVMHLFDAHVMQGSGYEACIRREPWSKWTLEQLVDWVRSVEPPELEEVADGGRAETISATNPVCAK